MTMRMGRTGAVSAAHPAGSRPRGRRAAVRATGDHGARLLRPIAAAPVALLVGACDAGPGPTETTQSPTPPDTGEVGTPLPTTPGVTTLPTLPAAPTATPSG